MRTIHPSFLNLRIKARRFASIPFLSLPFWTHYKSSYACVHGHYYYYYYYYYYYDIYYNCLFLDRSGFSISSILRILSLSFSLFLWSVVNAKPAFLLAKSFSHQSILSHSVRKLSAASLKPGMAIYQGIDGYFSSLSFASLYNCGKAGSTTNKKRKTEVKWKKINK